MHSKAWASFPRCSVCKLARVTFVKTIASLLHRNRVPEIVQAMAPMQNRLLLSSNIRLFCHGYYSCWVRRGIPYF